MAILGNSQVTSPAAASSATASSTSGRTATDSGDGGTSGVVVFAATAVLAPIPRHWCRSERTTGDNNETQKVQTPPQAMPPDRQDRRHRSGDASDQPAGDRDGVGEGPGECQD